MTGNTTEWAPLAATVRQALARRVHEHPQPAGSGLDGWLPRYDEYIVAVSGVAGSVGATTVSLAVATAAASAGPVRLVECAAAVRSGLVAAARAELGAGRGGWTRGDRDGVTLIRRSPGSLFAAPPPPPLEDAVLTVLDVGDLLAERPPERLAAAAAVGTWVLVARATIPSLRQLELVLDLGPTRDPIVAIVGRPPQRWPRSLSSAVQPRTRALLGTGRCVAFRYDRHLAVTGLTPDPLPAHLAASARKLLTLSEGQP